MSLVKWWVKMGYIGFAVIMMVVIGFAWFTYDLAVDIVENSFPELVRIVAEDNCLDNTIPYGGITMFQSYRNKLDDISTRSDIIEFEADALDVQYTSRASAPQKGEPIRVRLTGYWTINLPIAGGQLIHAPIVREVNVIGIRYYRDR